MKLSTLRAAVEAQKSNITAYLVNNDELLAPKPDAEALGVIVVQLDAWARDYPETDAETEASAEAEEAYLEIYAACQELNGDNKEFLRSLEQIGAATIHRETVIVERRDGLDDEADVEEDAASSEILRLADLKEAIVFAIATAKSLYEGDPDVNWDEGLDAIKLEEITDTVREQVEDISKSIVDHYLLKIQELKNEFQRTVSESIRLAQERFVDDVDPAYLMTLQQEFGTMGGTALKIINAIPEATYHSVQAWEKSSASELETLKTSVESLLSSVQKNVEAFAQIKNEFLEQVVELETLEKSSIPVTVFPVSIRTSIEGLRVGDANLEVKTSQIQQAIALRIFEAKERIRLEMMSLLSGENAIESQGEKKQGLLVTFNKLIPFAEFSGTVDITALMGSVTDFTPEQTEAAAAVLVDLADQVTRLIEEVKTHCHNKVNGLTKSLASIEQSLSKTSAQLAVIKIDDSTESQRLVEVLSNVAGIPQAIDLIHEKINSLENAEELNAAYATQREALAQAAQSVEELVNNVTQRYEDFLSDRVIAAFAAAEGTEVEKIELDFIAKCFVSIPRRIVSSLVTETGFVDIACIKNLGQALTEPAHYNRRLRVAGSEESRTRVAHQEIALLHKYSQVF